MIRRDVRFRPEGPSGVVLESRALLSTGLHAPSAIVAINAVPRTNSGTLRGTYMEKDTPGAGETLDLKGSGKIAGLGITKVSAQIHAVGRIASGHASGTGTFALKGGTISVAFNGPTQAGTGSTTLPTHFTFSITGGTGKYSKVTGTGTADLTLTPVGKITILASHGKFALKVNVIQG